MMQAANTNASTKADEKVTLHIGSQLISYLERLLLSSANEIGVMAEFSTQRLIALGTCLQRQADMPPEVKEAMSDIIMAMQTEDRHRQYMQNAINLLIAYRNMLEQHLVPAPLSEQALQQAMRSILDAVTLGEIRKQVINVFGENATFNNILNDILPPEKCTETQQEESSEELWQ